MCATPLAHLPKLGHYPTVEIVRVLERLSTGVRIPLSPTTRTPLGSPVARKESPLLAESQFTHMAQVVWLDFFQERVSELAEIFTPFRRFGPIGYGFGQ